MYYVLLQIEGHDDDVNTVAFADSTSQILYSGGDDGLCKVSVVAMYGKLLPGWREDGFLTQPFDTKNREHTNWRACAYAHVPFALVHIPRLSHLLWPVCIVF